MIIAKAIVTNVTDAPDKAKDMYLQKNLGFQLRNILLDKRF